VVVEDLPTDHRHHALKLLVSHDLPAAGAEIGELTFQDFGSSPKRVGEFAPFLQSEIDIKGFSEA
jgi:hypothetical protein